MCWRLGYARLESELREARRERDEAQIQRSYFTADGTGHMHRCAKVNGVWSCAKGCLAPALSAERTARRVMREAIEWVLAHQLDSPKSAEATLRAALAAEPGEGPAPLCIGWPTIEKLWRDGQIAFDDGRALIAASDLFRRPYPSTPPEWHHRAAEGEGAAAVGDALRAWSFLLALDLIESALTDTAASTGSRVATAWRIAREAIKDEPIPRRPKPALPPEGHPRAAEVKNEG